MALRKEVRLDALERQIREQEAQFEAEEQAVGVAPASSPANSVIKPADPVRPSTPPPSSDAPAFWTRRRIDVVVWLALLLILAVASWPLWRQKVPTTLGNRDQLPMAMVNLDTPMVSILGQLEGPYTLSGVLAANRLQLTNTKGEKLDFALLGLRAEPYPPVPAEANSIENTPVDPQEFKDYLAGMYQKYLGNQPFWILRMSSGAQAGGYLFKPGQTANPTHGQAELINATLLRKGYGLLDLNDASQPFFDVLAECQRAALSEYDARTAAGDSAWYHFNLTFPRDQLAALAPAPAQ